MADTLDSNFTISGSKTFDTVAMDNQNYDINGTNNNGDTLNIFNIEADNWSSTTYDNVNIWYNAKSGWDKLMYGGTFSKHVDIVVGNYSDNYFYKATGGYKKGEKDINTLDIFFKNVERVDLTTKDDKVDLRGLSNLRSDDPDAADYYELVEFYGYGGEDVMHGSSFTDVFFGDNGDDTLYGNDGDDYLDGGYSDDRLFGGEGNDTIVTGGGGDRAFGGGGEDAIHAHINLTKGYDVLLFGDLVKDNGIYVLDSTTSDYNEADVFAIGHSDSSSGTVDAAGTSFAAFIEEKGTAALVSSGAKLIASSMGYGWAAPMIELGYYAIEHAITGGAKSKGLDNRNGNTEGKLTIGDFDAWNDTAILSLQDMDQGPERRTLTATVVESNDQVSLRIKVNDKTFAQLDADHIYASIHDGIFENSSNEVDIGTTEYEDIFENLYSNGVWVYKSNDGNVRISTSAIAEFNPQTSNISEGDLSGDFSAEYIADLTADLGLNQGVLLLGDYGGGTYFANGLGALAGSNSNDILYAGVYDKSDYDELFDYATTSVNIYAGAGDDVIWGSTNDGDDLYGGEGDDYIHFGAYNGTAAYDEIYGGTGLDVASFVELDVSGIQDLTVGLSVDLAVLVEDTGYANAYYSVVKGYVPAGTTSSSSALGDTLAILYDVEGVDGTAQADKMRGNAEANLFYGNDGDDNLFGAQGADTLDGGDGNDVLTGGNGNDLLLGGWNADTIKGGNDHDTLKGGQGWDELYGENGYDLLEGGWGNDLLEGGEGHDILRGGTHDDTLDGGKGNDLMTGGDGLDTFLFRAREGADEITDFKSGDTIVFEQLTDTQLLALQQSLEVDDKYISTGSNSEVLLSGINVTELSMTSSMSSGYFDVELQIA